MKNIKTKYALAVMLLICNLITFAQVPNPDPTGGDPDPDDVLAPISDYVWVLAVVAILYMAFKFYKFNKLSKI